MFETIRTKGKFILWTSRNKLIALFQYRGKLWDMDFDHMEAKPIS